VIDDYFKALGETMARESQLMGRVYRHPGKLGESREALLTRFLAQYLPRRYGVTSGFALLGSGLSTQQDVVVYDQLDNPVLMPDSGAPLFPPSAVAALVEVKSRLTRRELRSAVRKAARVKRELRRSFANHPNPPAHEALVTLFAFSSSYAPARALRELKAVEDEDNVDIRDRLDLVCVLGSSLIVGGSLMAGMDSGAVAHEDSRPERLAVAVDNSLFVFYTRLLDYVALRGVVRPRLMSYLPPETPMGIVVGNE
jgi:hypothetical protein